MLKVRFISNGSTRSFHIQTGLIEMFNQNGEMIEYAVVEDTDINILKNIINENRHAEIDMLEIK